MPAWSSVLDSAGNGFTVRTTMVIQSSPDKVYEGLTSIGEWWSKNHTFSGDSSNLILDLNPDQYYGCFCERMNGKGFARHMEVVYIAPGEKLVMRGGLGPLQSMATTGSMTISLTAFGTNDVSGTNTKLEVTYAVSGYLPAGLQSLAAPVDTVITEQFIRLKQFIESGSPEPKQ